MNISLRSLRNLAGLQIRLENSILNILISMQRGWRSGDKMDSRLTFCLNIFQERFMHCCSHLKKTGLHSMHLLMDFQKGNQDSISKQSRSQTVPLISLLINPKRKSRKRSQSTKQSHLMRIWGKSWKELGGELHRSLRQRKMHGLLQTIQTLKSF